ncbi:MAG TPA: anti-phage protein KwaA [Bacteroidia bacterium]|jgi:hypothetical protein|nr:anti-phage protein KwaA [Bacteroidia bacterium]
MKKAIQILLFVISYVPLYFILLFQSIDDTFYGKHKQFIGWSALAKRNELPLIFLTIIILSVSAYFILYKILLTSSTVKLKVSGIQDNNAEHLSYLATYVLPFVGVKFDTWQNTLATVALFYVLGHIYIKTNLILTNPTLTFFGFTISGITDAVGSKKVIIYKGVLKKDTELDVIHLNQNIYLLK